MRTSGFVAVNQRNHPAGETRRKQAAARLYNNFKRNGLLAKIRARITGDFPPLVSLSEVTAPGACLSRRSNGLQSVEIGQISGSVNPGRTNDFDGEFRPLRGHTRDRWVNLAAIRSNGRKLPPVALIQVQGAYFVQDGHHRISVARARGEQRIEAHVTVWQ